MLLASEALMDIALILDSEDIEKKKNLHFKKRSRVAALAQITWQ